MLTSGRVLVAIGLVLLLTLEIAAGIRAAACLAWMLLSGLELQRIERGFESVVAIRLSSNGEIALLNPAQEWLPGTLQTGSMVLSKMAWLRVTNPNGELIVELLRGNARQSHEWRRLQVIWRHIGASS